jgi:hypothetical protein
MYCIGAPIQTIDCSNEKSGFFINLLLNDFRGLVVLKNLESISSALPLDGVACLELNNL